MRRILTSLLVALLFLAPVVSEAQNRVVFGESAVATLTTACASASVTNATCALKIDVRGLSSVGIQFVGTETSATLQFEGTIDGTTWNAVHVYNVTTAQQPVINLAIGSNVSGSLQGGVGGLLGFRVRLSALSGTNVVVNLQAQQGAPPAAISIGASNTSPGPGQSVQSAILLNSSTTSAANTANVVTLTGAANQRIVLRAVVAYCSAGSATFTISDGNMTFTGASLGTVVGTPVWPVVAAGASLAGLPWTAPTGNSFTITAGACGVSNTSTVIVWADQQ